MTILNTSNTGIGIDLLEFYVPKQRYSVEEYLRLPKVGFDYPSLVSIWNWGAEPEVLLRFFAGEEAALSGCDEPFDQGDVAEFIDHTGVTHVHCASAESCSDMALAVASRILKRSQSKRVSGLICFHSTLNEEPDSSISGRLQHELGLKGVTPFAVGQKSGNASLMALKVACHMMMAEPDLTPFLLVGAEKVIPPYRRLFARTTLIGDSACAMILDRDSERCRILCLDILDSSRGWGSKSQNGGGYHEMVRHVLPANAALLIDRLFSELNVTWPDVALLLVSNFNSSVTHDVMTTIGASKQKMLTGNISEYGSLTSSDLVVNLATALERSIVKPGDLVVCLNIGLDLSVGCLALRV
jgi:3-oxoacyl-[acyl-carrier-protein] synthase III